MQYLRQRALRVTATPSGLSDRGIEWEWTRRRLLQSARPGKSTILETEHFLPRPVPASVRASSTMRPNTPRCTASPETLGRPPFHRSPTRWCITTPRTVALGYAEIDKPMWRVPHVSNRCTECIEQVRTNEHLKMSRKPRYFRILIISSAGISRNGPVQGGSAMDRLRSSLSGRPAIQYSSTGSNRDTHPDGVCGVA